MTKQQVYIHIFTYMAVIYSTLFLLSVNKIAVVFILSVGVDGLTVEDGQHYLFWYKKL